MGRSLQREGTLLNPLRAERKRWCVCPSPPAFPGPAGGLVRLGGPASLPARKTGGFAVLHGRASSHAPAALGNRAVGRVS